MYSFSVAQEEKSLRTACFHQYSFHQHTTEGAPRNPTKCVRLGHLILNASRHISPTPLANSLNRHSAKVLLPFSFLLLEKRERAVHKEKNREVEILAKNIRVLKSTHLHPATIYLSYLFNFLQIL